MFMSQNKRYGNLGSIDMKFCSSTVVFPLGPKAENGDRVLGEGAASPSPEARESIGAL